MVPEFSLRNSYAIQKDPCKVHGMVPYFLNLLFEKLGISSALLQILDFAQILAFVLFSNF